MWGSIRLGGFSAQFPQPRIPRLLGSDRDLPAGNSVYPKVRIDVPIAPQVATLVSGAVAAVVALDTSLIANWSTRFASLFKEYAIVGAALELRPNNIAVTAGIVAAFLDEKSNAAPSQADMQDRPKLDMTCGPLFVPRAYRIKWMPGDLLDLDYTSSATNYTPVWLKIFSSVAATYTTATTTGQILVTGTLALEFRGYA